MIKTLKKKFNTLVGLSDHTLGTEAAVAAVSLGAVAIEKHFKLNKLDKTPDSDFSIDPSQLKELVTQVNSVWKGLVRVNLIEHRRKRTLYLEGLSIL